MFFVIQYQTKTGLFLLEVLLFCRHPRRRRRRRRRRFCYVVFIYLFKVPLSMTQN